MLWIRDILVRIRIRVSVPLTFGSVFCFLLTSVFKDKKSKRSRKKRKIKVFLTFLLVDGRIRIRTKYWRIRIQEVLTANTNVSRSTTLLLPQDRTCKQQEKPSALQREHPAFQTILSLFHWPNWFGFNTDRIWSQSKAESTTVALIWGSAYMWPFKCAT